MSTSFKSFTGNSTRNNYLNNNHISIYIDNYNIKDKVSIFHTSPKKTINIDSHDLKFPLIKRDSSQDKNYIIQSINNTFIFPPNKKNIYLSKLNKSRNTQNEFNYRNKEFSSVFPKHNNNFKKKLFDLKKLIIDENINNNNDFINKRKKNELNNKNKSNYFLKEYLLNNKPKKLLNELSIYKINNSEDYKIKNRRNKRNGFLKYQKMKCGKSLNEVNDVLKNLNKKIKDNFEGYKQDTEDEFDKAIKDYLSNK